MSDLFNKLNVLLRASINSSLSGGGNSRAPSRADWADVPPQEIETQLHSLRHNVDEALNAEDAMQRRLEDQQRQIEALDAQVDSALMAGDEANARFLQSQLQRQKQQATMLQAELEDHRQATSALIEQVNQLEAIVSDVRARHESPGQMDDIPAPEEVMTEPPRTAPTASEPTSFRVPINVSVNPGNAGNAVSNSGQSEARPPNVPAAVNPSAKPTAADDSDEALARRRSRLSLPDKPAS